MSTLLAIKYTPGTPSDLEILDQLILPHQSYYIKVQNSQKGWTAIKKMQVRGAPAIAIVAALSLAVEISTLLSQGSEELETAEGVAKFVHEKLDYLITSRPTAVNLADAAGKLKKVVDDAAAEGLSGAEVAGKYISASEAMLEKDVADNKAIGDHGAEWIRQASGKSEGISVLTHCNTGSLATAGYGTALGIIRSLFSQGSLTHAYCTETRPYNQGSRLTAYELVYEKIPATLITDNMAAALLSQKDVSAIVVGADRVAANGDTANKIGTYQLALIARALGVKFVVAAPTTSIDLKTASGKEIKIEERPGVEVLTMSGPRFEGVDKETGRIWYDLDRVTTITQAANGIGTWNPSFDVTPAELIDAIVTETGVVIKDDTGAFPVADAFR